jgi:DNA repair protein
MARAGGFFAPPARHDEQHQHQQPSHQQRPPQQPQQQQPQQGAGGGFVGSGGGGGNQAAAVEGCERCGDPRPHAVSPKWLSAFGVALCTACRAADELVTKTAAKEAYLVSDADLAPLGTLQRENPRHAQFAPMRLYLASQVAAVAARKHGGAEGLQRARAARVGSKLEARAAKRRREQAREEAAGRERARLEREAEARLAEMEGGGMDEVLKQEEGEEDEEEGAGAGRTTKKTTKKASEDGGGGKRGGGKGAGAAGGRSEVVVDSATGRRGRRFGEGLAVVDEAEVEEL